MTARELRNCEGLEYLTWDMFNCPRAKGESGYKFMEREPVYILDSIVKHLRRSFQVELGYTSQAYADQIGLTSFDSHRIGKAIRLRVLNPKKRFQIVSELILRGVRRISLSYETVYFDTDNVRGDALCLVDVKNVLKPFHNVEDLTILDP